MAMRPLKSFSKREVVRLVFEGRPPPYVPWHFQFTKEPWAMLTSHFRGEPAAEAAIDNHLLELGSAIGFFEDLGANRTRDAFGVVWDRSVDRAQVRQESRRLLALGRDGGYIFAPAHAVQSDVPPANLFAFIDEAHRQRQL